MKTYLTCYRCAKLIKRGEYIHHVPPLWVIRLGIDFEKAFHAKCYEMEEKDALKELTK